MNKTKCLIKEKVNRFLNFFFFKFLPCLLYGILAKALVINRGIY